MNNILKEILKRGQESDSDSLYITYKDEILLDWTSEKNLPPLEIMSIGKSIVALAIGVLIDERKIDNIDVLVSDFYPEWQQGQKKLITLRMLMNHTSGLQTIPNGNEISQAPDCVQLALCAELSEAPGSKFFYNNKAVNLLSGIIRLISGKSVKEFVKEKIFDPLNIVNFGWRSDEAGNFYSLGGVQMMATDLHKIGKLILQRGYWKQQKIISEHWLDQMLTVVNMPETFHSFPQYLQENCGLLWWVYSQPKIFSAQGYLGQWLYIMPEHDIIAIRQIRKDKRPLDEVDDFKDFKDLIHKLQISL